jgi:replicative DNA helicase
MSTTPQPHAAYAETFLISCAFHDTPQVVSDAMRLGITVDSFLDPKNALVWSHVLQLCNESAQVDVATLTCSLDATGRLEYVGGYPWIVQLSEYAPTTAQTKIFARHIRDAQIRRELLRANAEIEHDASAANGVPAVEVVEDAARQIMGIGQMAETETWSDAVSSALAHVALKTDPSRATVAVADELSFGLESLDRSFGKMRFGQVVVVAARPSVGKSSFARQIAIHVALRACQQVLFASLEVVGKALALNMAQTLSGISSSALSPSVHAQEVDRFKRALAEVCTGRMDILAASNVSLATIRSRAQILKARGTPVRLVVVDYLQLLPDCVPMKGENRAGSVGRASRALKAFALEQNCVVLLLSQLNRDSARENRSPQLYDLRESGDIEQDADKVIMLHRPEVNKLTGIKQDEESLAADCPSFYIMAIQSKGRDDGTGAIDLMFKRSITKFEQIAMPCGQF